MRFEVDHLTCYRYDQPVQLAEHRIRLRPRDDPGLRVLRYTLEIDPKPVAVAEHTDGDGNRVAVVQFTGETTELAVRSRITARSQRVPRAPRRVAAPTDPWSRAARLRTRLEPWIGTEPPAPPVQALADGLRRGCADVEAFTSRLNQWLYQSIDREIRDFGMPLPPDETLRRGRGACRDLTVLFIAACRAQGIAARFVSGYQHRQTDAEAAARRYMHAWPEVFLPGSGWRGFDPTRGRAVAEAHLALAASARPQDAAPIEGSYLGAASSTMQVELRIDVDDLE